MFPTNIRKNVLIYFVKIKKNNKKSQYNESDRQKIQVICLTTLR